MKKENNFLYVFLHVPKTGGGTFNQHLKKNLKKEFARPLEIINNQKDKNKVKIISSHDTYYRTHKLISNRKPRYIVFIRDPAERIVSAYNYSMNNFSEKDLVSFNKWYKTQINNEMCRFLDRKLKGKTGIQVSSTSYKLMRGFKLRKSIKNLLFAKSIFKKLLFFRGKKLQKKEFENAKKLLNKCWFIGITKELDKDLPSLFKKLGVPQKYKISHKAVKNLNKDNKDLDFVKKRFILDDKIRKKLYNDNEFDFELYKYAKKLNQKTRKNILN